MSVHNPVVLEFAEGITQYSNRVGLKTLMSNYGDVDVCWIPPVWDREKEVAYVKFKDAKGAEMAMQAMASGQVTMHGVALKARYRIGTGRAPRLADGPGEGGYSSRNVGRIRGGRDERCDREIYGSRELFIADMKARGQDWRRMDSRARKEKKAKKKEKKEKKEGRDRSRDGDRPKGKLVTAEIVVSTLLGEKQGLGLKLEGLEIKSFELETAAAFGWRVGDAIVGINGDDVPDVETLQEKFVAVKSSGALPITFKVERYE